MSNRNTNWILTIVVLATIAVIPATALSQVEFTFEGQADMLPGIDMVGAYMTVYGYANPPVKIATPKLQSKYVGRQVFQPSFSNVSLHVSPRHLRMMA